MGPSSYPMILCSVGYGLRFGSGYVTLRGSLEPVTRNHPAVRSPPSELVRRQDMFGIFKGAKEEAQQAKQAQVELAEAFEAVGVNFMKVSPIIRNALLKEALA